MIIAEYFGVTKLKIKYSERHASIWDKIKKCKSLSCILERGLIEEIDFYCSHLNNLEIEDIPYRLKVVLLYIPGKHNFIHLKIESYLAKWTKNGQKILGYSQL